MRTFLAMVLLAGASFATDLSRYGSLSRQQTVITNLRQQEYATKLREYRLFREEIRRQTPYEPIYFVRSYSRSIPVRIVQ